MPTRNVTVRVSTPSDVACDDRYSMFSTPLICSSSGAATASARARGLAPGYAARTTIEGGTTSGYSLIGSVKMEIAPATKMTIESAAAKIGRSMKKREKRMSAPVDLLRRVRPSDQGFAPGSRASASMGTSVAVTRIPGRTRWRPLTTTLSPGWIPAATTR